jgi:hypothetical protein
VTDPARYVAQLVERLLATSEDDEIAQVDMHGMMAAVDVEMADGTWVVIEVNPL